MLLQNSRIKKEEDEEYSDVVMHESMQQSAPSTQENTVDSTVPTDTLGEEPVLYIYIYIYIYG